MSRHQIELVIEDDKWQSCKNLESLAREIVNATIHSFDESFPPSEIHILATSDYQMQKLNEQFRQKGNATNILSWPVDQLNYPKNPSETMKTEEKNFLGDIAISYDFCHNEAKQNGISLQQHLSHLLVHGTLHLLGFDHINDQSTKSMEKLETLILSKMGIGDPYTIQSTH